MWRRTAVVVVFGCASMAPRTASQDCSGGTFLVSAAVVTGLAVYDIATAPASAHRYNDRHVSVAPIMSVRDRSYGMMVSLPLGRSRRPVPMRSQASGNRKSPGMALGLSLGSTVLPMGAGAAAQSTGGAWLFLGGLVVGPSVGHFYAEQHVRGLATAGLRAGAVAIGLSSIVPCLSD